MTTRVAVPRKGRPLEAMLERLAAATGETAVADDVISTLRYEKAVTKGAQSADGDVYDRLAAYSDTGDGHPEYTLVRDDRDGMPRRVVFDAVTFETAHGPVHLVGREEPFRALRTHEFALGFDSADLVLEKVVRLVPDPLADIAAVNDRIDPRDTDVRVVNGLGDTVHHTLLGQTDVHRDAPLDREFVRGYEGPLCISPRYERLVEAILGTDALDGVEFTYPNGGKEEAAVARAGLGVYLTQTGTTAREYGLTVGEQLFPSETVLLENEHEVAALADCRPGEDRASRLARIKELFAAVDTELAVQ